MSKNISTKNVCKLNKKTSRVNESLITDMYRLFIIWNLENLKNCCVEWQTFPYNTNMNYFFVSIYIT